MDLSDVTFSDILNVFWQAMENGWCSGKKVQKETIAALPGYKCIRYKSGEFTVLDAYSINQLNDKSEGKMTIWFKDIVVWVMSYGGQYPKEVIPLVKYAIQDAMKDTFFCGGRGPKNFIHQDFPGYIYTNDLQEGYSSFHKFAGCEKIMQWNEVIGYHDYFGMALIEINKGEV